MGWVTSVAASTGTVTATGVTFSMVLPAPRVAYTYRDLEVAAVLYDRRVEVAKSTDGESSAAVDSATSLVHPTKGERLALIRSSSAKDEVS
jgi:hypothetical protein